MFPTLRCLRAAPTNHMVSRPARLLAADGPALVIELRHVRHWQRRETARLLALVARARAPVDWAHVAAQLPGRTPHACLTHLKQVRRRMGLPPPPGPAAATASKRRPWAADEDRRLRHLVALLGRRWTQIARALGASRSAVQCSQRWKLLVRRDRRASDPRPRPPGHPRVTRPWTDVESAQLLRLLEEHGRFDYGELSKRLPGFTYGQMYQGLQRLVYAGRPRPWTRAERRRLAQLVHAHPGDWPRVAAGLSARTPLQCRLMYGARLLGGPAAHKRWTPAESARLVRLVNACRRPPLAPDAAAIARALDAGAYACALERDLLAAAAAAAPEPAQPPDAAHRPVPWLLVATYMPGRTPMQCRCKWQRLKEAAELPAHSGPWSPAEDLALYTLCADIPGHWRAIQRRLPRRRNMNAIRARHTLISRVVRVIRACRPAWDPRADAMAEVHMRCEVLSWFHASAEGYRPDDPFDCPLDVDLTGFSTIQTPP